MKASLNIYGQPLIPCCMDPITGFTRNGFCTTHELDPSLHLLCGFMTQEFLDYTKQQGNDLSTPVAQWNFPGLRPGDFWCLCVSRWLQAEKAGKAPLLRLEACHQDALRLAPLALLERYAYVTS